MKKMLMLLLALVLVFSFTACSPEPEKEDQAKLAWEAAEPYLNGFSDNVFVEELNKAIAKTSTEMTIDLSGIDVGIIGDLENGPVDIPFPIEFNDYGINYEDSAKMSGKATLTATIKKGDGVLNFIMTGFKLFTGENGVTIKKNGVEETLTINASDISVPLVENSVKFSVSMSPSLSFKFDITGSIITEESAKSGASGTISVSVDGSDYNNVAFKDFISNATIKPYDPS